MNDGGQQARKCRSGVGTIVQRHGVAMSIAVALLGVMASTGGWSESSGAADLPASGAVTGAVEWHPGHSYAPMSGIVPLAPSVMQSNYDNPIAPKRPRS